MSAARLLRASAARGRGPNGPPAVWAAFAAQGRWKNWVLAAQLVALFFLGAVCVAVARTQPDVIVVTDNGRGHYVEAGTASRALVDFLRTQRGRASEVTLLGFTERFVRLTLGVNSTTFDEAWPEALTMMAAPLREKSEREAQRQKLADTYRLAQVRTRVELRALEVVERREGTAHVRARVTRRREGLLGDTAPSEDEVQVDVVLADVARSRVKPDALEILDWRVGAPTPGTSPSPQPEHP